MIDLEENDKKIKPAMTTDNRIMLKNMEEALTIPREALYADNGKTYVFLKKGRKILKKEVVPGLENDEEIVINSGLKQHDRIVVNQPEDANSIPFLEETGEF